MAGSRKKRKSLKTNLKFELYGILLLTFSVLALYGEGSIPRSLKYLFRFFAGTWDWVIPIVLIYSALFAMIRRQWPKSWSSRKSGLLLVLLGLLIMSHMSLFMRLDPKGQLTSPAYILSQSWYGMTESLKSTEAGMLIFSHGVGGGMVGALLYAGLFFLFDNLGTSLIQYTLFVIGFILITGYSFVDLASRGQKRFQKMFSALKTLLIRFIYLMSGKKYGVLSGKRPKAIPVFEAEEELDEYYESPIKTKKKKRLFFELMEKKPQKSEFPFPQSDTSEELEPSVSSHLPSPLLSGQVVTVADTEEVIPVIRDFQDHINRNAESGLVAAPQSQLVKDQVKDGEIDIVLQDKTSAAPYHLPPFYLLLKPNNGKGGEHSDYKANARKLEATLESFGVRAKVLEVVRGPSVTRYEIQPDTGVKVSRIVSLTDDIALALAAKDIRMEAPIPGKAAIGIEVPNSEVSLVTLREVMESSAFHESESKLTIALGRDIAGLAIVGNLARMPHLLVAGATGSGKSVCINGIITSILYKSKPDEVKFLMIDPKMVELNVYNGIPHLLAPVVTDPRRASLALKKVVSEMEKRYELFSKSGTRNIEGYNALISEKNDGTPALPYIVVIVDELADLMMVAAHDVEDSICRLAQMARAAGIHLIIATQRPSVDVITGVIKANIPSRIAFGVSSQVDSRTILDMAGAEKLLGRGDMLFLPVGASKPIRVQGAFLSDQEVEAVVQFVSQQEKANYQEEMVPEVEETTDNREQFDDELYDQAVQIILEAKQASVSLLQRRMRVGYTRAARLIDMMEAKGIVGPYEGSKPREVLITMEQFQQNRLSS